MSRFVNTPHGRADLDDPPFTVRTAGTSCPPREPATAAISAVRALDMSAADHTPGASGPAATAAEPAPETTPIPASTPLLFTADMDKNTRHPTNPNKERPLYAPNTPLGFLFPRRLSGAGAADDRPSPSRWVSEKPSENETDSSPAGLADTQAARGGLGGCARREGGARSCCCWGLTCGPT